MCRYAVLLLVVFLFWTGARADPNLGKCVFGARCECRKFIVDINSEDRPKSGLTGPFLSFGSVNYPHGEKCDDAPFPGPIKPRASGKFEVGSPGESVYVGVKAQVYYNLFSDDGLVDLGCQLVINLLNPFWPTGGYERASLVGEGCKNPPIRGKPPPGSSQVKYDLQLETGQVQIATLSFAQYYLHYKNSVVSNEGSRFFWGNKEDTVVGPTDRVCKGKLPWIPLSEQGFENIEVLVSRFFVTAGQAGKDAWKDYEQAQCYPSGEISVKDACYRFIGYVSKSGIMREFQYRGRIKYLCSSGKRTRALTSSGNMYSEYVN